MTCLKSALIVFALLGLTNCAHHQTENPVDSGNSSLFSGNAEPIDHEGVENSTDGGVQSASTQPVPARANQHSSIKTSPDHAEYGAPTGTASGSGATP